MVAVVVMVVEAELKSGEGEGGGWGLKHTSRELGVVVSESTVIMENRSSPVEAVAAGVVLPSDGAKGSWVRKWRHGQ